MPTIGKVLENWVVNGTFTSYIEFGRDIVEDHRIYSSLVQSNFYFKKRL